MEKKVAKKETKQETKKVIVAKSIQFKDGEVDIRQLSEADYKQLMWRCLNDMWVFQNQQAMALNKLEFLVQLLAEEKGIDVEKSYDKYQELLLKEIDKK